MKKNVFFVIGITALLAAACTEPLDPDPVQVPPSREVSVEYRRLSRMSFIDGSLHFDSNDPRAGPLQNGVKIPIRIAESASHPDKDDSGSLIEKWAYYGYLLVESVTRTEIYFGVYLYYTAAGSAVKQGSYTIKSEDAVDITGDGKPDISYTKNLWDRNGELVTRPGMENASFLNFFSYRNDATTTILYSTDPEQYSGSDYPSGVMGVTSKGRMVVSEFKTDGKSRAAVKNLKAGDIVIDMNKAGYSQVNGSVDAAKYRSARSIEDSDMTPTEESLDQLYPVMRLSLGTYKPPSEDQGLARNAGLTAKQNYDKNKKDIIKRYEEDFTDLLQKKVELGTGATAQINFGGTGDAYCNLGWTEGKIGFTLGLAALLQAEIAELNYSSEISLLPKPIELIGDEALYRGWFGYVYLEVKMPTKFDILLKTEITGHFAGGYVGLFGGIVERGIGYELDWGGVDLYTIAKQEKIQEVVAFITNTQDIATGSITLTPRIDATPTLVFWKLIELGINLGVGLPVKMELTSKPSATCYVDLSMDVGAFASINYLIDKKCWPDNGFFSIYKDSVRLSTIPIF